MTRSGTHFYLLCLGMLISIFCYHNYIIYTDKGIPGTVSLTGDAAHGQQLWQQNNCFSCHQLYGLGGYLGPDLTNVYSQDGKGADYIKSMLNSGIKSMPRFNFSETEKHAITTYLKEVDQTGDFPNHNATFDQTGWVQIKYKNEK